MFILRNILSPLQQEFNHRCKGDERGVWFVYTLLAVITHFTASRSANLLRCLQTLFGLSLSQRRFYIFNASYQNYLGHAFGSLDQSQDCQKDFRLRVFL
jgi:hypothetical protein